MATQGRKTLEEKVDFLIEESEKTKQERKREKVLSRIDGFFYSLLALSTFTSGVVISQHDFLTAKGSGGLLLSIIAVLLAMLFSFIIGFKGMLYDSMENRILAWCLLLVCLMFYLILTFGLIVEFLLPNAPTLAYVIIGVGSFVGGFIERILSAKFTNWVEARLTPLLGQKVDVWGKIKGKIFPCFLVVFTLSLVASIVITALLQRT